MTILVRSGRNAAEFEGGWKLMNVSGGAGFELNLVGTISSKNSLK